MTHILKSGGLLLVAFGIVLGSCEFASAQSAKSTSSCENLARSIQSNTDADNKVKSLFQELVFLHMQGTNVENKLAQVNALLLQYPRIGGTARSELYKHRRELEAELSKMKAKSTRLEADFKARKTELLVSLNKSCVPALQRLTEGLDRKTLVTVAELFDLFILVEQKELSGLLIGASFVDQPVWREAAKCLSRHGVVHLAEIKKMLVSKNNCAKYAAALALGELGEQVDGLDKGIYEELLRMNGTLKNATMMDRNEKRTRQKILDTAMESLRPKQK